MSKLWIDRMNTGQMMARLPRQECCNSHHRRNDHFQDDQNRPTTTLHASAPKGGFSLREAKSTRNVAA
jgi:hypothetical protein